MCLNRTKTCQIPKSIGMPKLTKTLKTMFHDGLILQVESIPKAMEMVLNGTRNYPLLGDDLDVTMMQSKYCWFTAVKDHILPHSDIGLYVRDGFDGLDLTKINQGHAELTRVARSRLLRIYFPKKTALCTWGILTHSVSTRCRACFTYGSVCQHYHCVQRVLKQRCIISKVG